ncbi:MAG: ATP-binding protein [Proteobacteria bacterium]|nr:ATP-binding protein [Pseudomonadota bacterium]
MNYPRTLLRAIESHINTGEIIVVTGMRRVGKTTLLQMIYEKIESDNKVFLDLDNILDQRIFEENDYNNIWANLKPFGITQTRKAYIFLDEIQTKPGIVKAIKYLYDHYDVKFFLTGSSSFYLKNLFPESLAGRKVIFELYPLSFEEFLVFRGRQRESDDDLKKKDTEKNLISFEKLKKHYEEYLTYGGFPQVVLNDNVTQKISSLRDIFNSYFEKDVRTLADFRNMSAFHDLIFLLMQRVGSKMEVAKLASEAVVSRETVYSYLSFLQGTYFIFLVPPYSTNVDREVSSAKKVYFCDTGIINQFGKISDGNILENACFHTLRKFGEVRYYQRRKGSEIDFVIPERHFAFEVKSRANISDVKKLTKISSSLNMQQWFVISREFVKGDGIILAQDL